MTDNQRAYERAICEVAHVNDIGDVSDGFHTFNQLYHQRAMLFAALVNQNHDISWKSRKHEDGELCFGGGWFVVTIDTPAGPYGYHYEDKYWDLFNCKELERAKHWDGYTEKDVGRLMSLPATKERHGEWVEKPPYADETVKGLEFQIVCSRCDEQNASITFDENSVPIAKTFYKTRFCPNCGAQMRRNNHG